ncbi:MAG: MFS transporter [Gracilibacteraceae bacterium]|jgi:sugar phosphate permease|nr:MFS transporter [Gracilibacteraceae bacterium]
MNSEKISVRHWITIIASFCLSASIAFITTGFSFLIVPVTGDLGFEVAKFALYFTFFMAFGLIGLPLWANIYKRIGVKWGVVISGALTTVFVVGLSFCHSLLSFYVMGAGIGLSFQGATVMPAVILINTWFIKKKGMILGIVMTGSGVGGAVLSYNFPKFLVTNTWQSAYLLLAACFCILCVPVALFLIKNKPADCGLQMYGWEEAQAAQAAQGGTGDATKQEAAGITLKEAWKTPHLYLLYGGVFVLSAVMSFSQYVPAHLTAIGVEVQTLAILTTILMVANIVSKIIMGTLNDRLGVNTTLILVMALGLASMFFFPRAGIFGLALIAVCLFPFGACFSTVLPPLQTGAIFGNKDYTAIWGIMGTASTLGTAVGPPIWGAIFDANKSYVPGMYFSPILIVIGTVMCVVAVKTKSKLYPK